MIDFQELLSTISPLTADDMRTAFVGDMPKLEGQVEVREYDPEWPRLYGREAARLRDLLGAKVLALEHVGSTAVPGLCAMPIIDIDLSLENSVDEAAYLPMLEQAGYRLVIREPDWYEQRIFKGPDTNINLHVSSLGCVEAIRRKIFRDWLRENAEDRQRYGDLKRELAQRQYDYVYEYNNDKAPLIREIYERALGKR